MDGQMYGRMGRWADVWADGRTYGRTDGLKDRQGRQTADGRACMHIHAYCISTDHRYRKSLNRLLKVRYVPATNAALIAFFSCFFLWPLTVLMKQTRQPVCAIKQSVYLDVYDFNPNLIFVRLNLGCARLRQRCKLRSEACTIKLFTAIIYRFW